MKRTICVVTGSRSEYGLLKPLLNEIRSDPKLRLQIIATGMHLSRKHGLTYKDILKDGYHINEKIEIFRGSDTSDDITKAMGLGLIRFGDAYKRLKPDVVAVLGDRFEILSAIIPAFVNNIPVAHMSGGEVTQGALDDAFRHCITKMSHIHFTNAPEYRKRVIQLGESPKNVFCVGEVGLDNIRTLKLLSKPELEKAMGFKFGKRNLLVTFHPVTVENDTKGKQFKNILRALDELDDTHIIFTKANADPNGKVINRLIDNYVAENPAKAVAFVSMGQLRYMSAIKYVDGVVGNSSSGLVEVASYKKGAVNIGNRQTGRIKPRNVIDCAPQANSIRAAFKKLYSSKFQSSLRFVKNPYGDGKAAKRIVRVLRSIDLRNITKKKFHDVRFKI